MENTRLLYLLDSFFANTCSPAEKQELMLLLDSNQYDEAVKLYIDNSWDKTNSSQLLSDQQSKTILSAILSHNKGKVLSLVASPGIKKWYWVAAAVLLISFSATAFFLFQQSIFQQPAIAKGSNSPKMYNNDVAPGINGAVLTLADGSVIVLDSASDGNLARQGNAEILKTGGALQYVSKEDGDPSIAGFNTIGTARGRQFKLVLEDGTKVWLNAESSIHFPTVFGKKERQVEITGEAYFEVAKNPNRPFTVLVKGMQVQVLGTHFNVNAYNDETAINTTLLEGSVKVIKNDQAKMLSPGEQAHLDDNGEMKILKKVNTDEIVAWKNDLFSFDNTDIKYLMRQLSRWYDVEIVMPRNIAPVTFIGNISRKSNLSDVLKMLELTGEVSFSIEGKKVIVKM